MVEQKTVFNPHAPLVREHFPTISIGLPVYNGADFIGEALDSLLAQTLTDFELIISDNASTDNTGMICQEYARKDGRIRYLCQPENVGAEANFQLVLNEAKGEFFMWAACDDKWDKKWLEVVLKGMMKPDVVLSFGRVVAIDSDANIVRRCKVFDFSGSRIVRLVKYFLSEDYSGKACIIYGLYRTLFLKRVKTFDEYTAGIFSDMQFVFNCLQYGGVSIEENVVFYKRMAIVAVPKCTVSGGLKSVLLIDSARELVGYVSLPSKVIDRVVISVLIPFKYLKAVLCRNLRCFNMIK